MKIAAGGHRMHSKANEKEGFVQRLLITSVACLCS